MKAYVQEISTRSVDDFLEAMGVASGISKFEVPRIGAGLDETVGTFCTRAFDHYAFPTSTWTRPTGTSVRNTSQQVTSMAVDVATGMTATGERDIRDLDAGDNEDEVIWKGFKTSRRQRGLAR